MKKWLLIIFCLSLFAASCALSNKDRNAGRKIKWLATSGKFVVNKYGGKKRVLRGVNVSGMEYDSTGRRVSLADLIKLADNWKINIVRLPVNQEWWLSSAHYRSLIDERIKLLKSRKIYTIFDLQWINTTLKINPLPNEQSVELMSKVALKYRKEPAVLYDVYNEPRSCTHEEWAAWAGRLVESVQEVHPKALVFVNGIDWGYDLSGFMENPLPYNNIIYGTHLYPQKPGSGYNNEPEFDKYWKGIREKNLPLFIGEIGPEELNFDNEEQIAAFVDPHLAMIDSLKLGFIAWSWHDKPYLTTNGCGSPDSLTLFGKRIFEHLKKYRGN